MTSKRLNIYFYACIKLFKTSHYCPSSHGGVGWGSGSSVTYDMIDYDIVQHLVIIKSITSRRGLTFSTTLKTHFVSLLLVFLLEEKRLAILAY